MGSLCWLPILAMTGEQTALNVESLVIAFASRRETVQTKRKIFRKAFDAALPFGQRASCGVHAHLHAYDVLAKKFRAFGRCPCFSGWCRSAFKLRALGTTTRRSASTCWRAPSATST